MKKIMIITICLCSILAIAPFSVGFLAQKNYTELIASQSSKQVVFSNIDYSSGWLQSSITTQVNIIDPEVIHYYQNRYNTTAPLHINIKHQVQHGPLLFTNDGITLGLVSSQDTITFSKESAFALSKLTKDGIIATATSTINFNGTYHSNIHVASLEHQDHNVQFNTEPSTIQLTAFNATKKIETWINIPKATIKGNLEGDFQVQDLNLHMKRWQKDNTPLGEWEMNIASAQLQQDGVTLISGKEASSQASLQTQSNENTLLTFIYQAKFKSIQIKDTTYDDGQLHLSIKNIPSKAFASIASATSQQEAIDGGTKILSEGLLVDISELNVMTAQGEIVGKLHAQLPKLSTQQAEDLAYLRANTAINLDFSAPRDFVDTTPLVTQLPLFLMMGIIKEQDGIYSVNAILKENKLQLNGKDMPF